MKRFTLSFMTLLFSASVMLAQTQKTTSEQNKEAKKETKSERVALKKLEGNVVSVTAKDNFSRDFSNTSNVQWKRVNTYDEVSFIQGGKLTTAFYDFKGILVGTTQPKSITDLPAKAQQELKTKYKDYNVDKIILFDDNEANDTDIILYGIQMDDNDNYFIELSKGSQKGVYMVDKSGNISFLKSM